MVELSGNGGMRILDLTVEASVGRDVNSRCAVPYCDAVDGSESPGCETEEGVSLELSLLLAVVTGTGSNPRMRLLLRFWVVPPPSSSGSMIGVTEGKRDATQYIDGELTVFSVM